MFTILLIEDNPRDSELIQDALSSINIDYNIDIVTDGTQALDYLYYQGIYVNRKYHNPELILLDLYLPKIHGIDVLKKIKSDIKTKTIPVVMLTASDKEEYINECLRLGVTQYIHKTPEFHEFIEFIQEMGLISAQSQIDFEDGYIKIKARHINALKILIEQGINDAIDTLQSMSDLKMELNNLNIKMSSAQELTKNLVERLKSKTNRIRIVGIEFSGPVSGLASLALTYEDSSVIIKSLINDADNNEQVDISMDTFSEIANVLINRIVGSIGNFLKKSIIFSAPIYFATSKSSVMIDKSKSIIFIAQTILKVNQDCKIESDISLAFQRDSFKTLVQALEKKKKKTILNFYALCGI
ncbi:hypothetical protein GMMP15_140067 [Candidatus Magnetomoraceae bacterium gMMP-15]